MRSQPAAMLPNAADTCVCLEEAQLPIAALGPSAMRRLRRRLVTLRGLPMWLDIRRATGGAARLVPMRGLTTSSCRQRRPRPPPLAWWLGTPATGSHRLGSSAG